MRTIKNVIFDLGNVFIDIDFNKTKESFEKYGISDYAAKFSQHHASPFFQQFETGKITPNEFLDSFRQEFSTDITNEQIKDAWNAMLGNFSKEKMDWLKSVSKSYRTFLFSNTNKIHQDFFELLCIKEIGQSLPSFFEHAYYSHDLGLRKPSVESFKKILEEQQLKKEETLFVDDTIGNIEGAKKAGLATFFLDVPNGKKLTNIVL
ncbi:MAG: HAD family phosphatase [Pseudopedobacter saltans]|uniref:HAD family phosphatase n=1 Tax=Pseudopedobacter saltans TaxID=151895 RepID=A0A2W5HDR2_9SPHI|nr:MAG: HAD family phosphatase [Pseudopedobacter saltans]